MRLRNNVKRGVLLILVLGTVWWAYHSWASGMVRQYALGGEVGAAEVWANLGASVDSADQGGMTPLIFAARNGNIELVGYLLGRGADVSSVDASGNSALHWAVVNAGRSAPHYQVTLTKLQIRVDDYPATVRLLLLHEADPNRKNHAGKSALDLARRAHEDVIVETMTSTTQGR